MFHLGELLDNTGVISGVDAAAAALPITGLAYDTRVLESGNAFWAFAGANVDGREFAPVAVERGAAVVVSELEPLENIGVPWIRVDHARRALAMAAAKFFGHPDNDLAITAATGTNGKTTTSWILDQILRRAGKTTA